MGTLADELDFDSDWDEGAEDLITPLQTPSARLKHQTPTPFSDRFESGNARSVNGSRDSGVDVGWSPSPSQLKSLKTQTRRSDRHRESSLSVKGSQEVGFSIELEDALRNVAALVESNEQGADAAWHLDLASQADLEANMRLYRMSMNHVTKTSTQHLKTLVSLSSSLLLPSYRSQGSTILGSEEDCEVVIALLADMLHVIPEPDPRPAHELQSFQEADTDADETLLTLLDSLQMNRHGLTSAARTVRSVRQMTAELQQEYQATEAGWEWIESGQWDRKLESRLCAAECRDVLSWFEKTCDGLRKGLEEDLIVS